MARQKLEKVVAAQALEAAKAALHHLQKWSVQLEQKGDKKPRGFSQLYARARRIRDYLSRAMASHMHPVELDLDDRDCNVLASCLVFSLHGVGMELRYGKDLAPHDRAWLEEKREALSDLAVDLATEDIKIIPSPGTTKQPVAVVNMVMDRVRKKVRSVGTAAPRTQGGEEPGDKPARTKAKRNIQTGAWTDAWTGHRNPLPNLHEDEPAANDDEQQAKEDDHATGGFGPALRDPSMHSLATGSTPRVGTGGADPVERSTSGPGSGVRWSEAHDGDLEQLKSGVQEEQEEQEEQEGLALDSRLVRDPRLRTMIVLDIRALERARAASDYRLSAVHLCSVCEAVVVDVALTRRDKVKVKGTPETWRLDEVVKALLGDKFTTSDRASLFHLVACRNLIRPSIQLHNPIVVTRATLKTMIEFVQRLLVELGVCGSGSGSPSSL